MGSLRSSSPPPDLGHLDTESLAVNRNHSSTDMHEPQTILKGFVPVPEPRAAAYRPTPAKPYAGQGSEYVFTLVKLFIASTTPSL